MVLEASGRVSSLLRIVGLLLGLGFGGSLDVPQGVSSAWSHCLPSAYFPVNIPLS